MPSAFLLALDCNLFTGTRPAWLFGYIPFKHVSAMHSESDYSLISLVSARKKSADQTSRAAEFATNGRTSAFACS